MRTGALVIRHYSNNNRVYVNVHKYVKVEDVTDKTSDIELHNIVDNECSVVGDLLFNVLSIVGGSSVFVFLCYALLCVHSSFAIILKRKRELVALLLLSYRMYCY